MQRVKTIAAEESHPFYEPMATENGLKIETQLLELSVSK
jgi:hypothetical protein